MNELLENYCELFKDVGNGFMSLLTIIFAPILFLILNILPYGITILFGAPKLKKGYRYLYFVPCFIKKLTISLRK